MKLLLAQQ